MGTIIDCAAFSPPSGSRPRVGQADIVARARSAARQPCVTVQRDEEWLLLDAPLSCEGPRDLSCLLAWNAELSGPAKFCLSSDGSARLRAEVPLDPADADTPGEDPDSLLADALASMDRAAVFVRREAPVEAEPTSMIPEPPDVMSICELSGWPCVERAHGRWMAELEGTSSYLQAEIGVRGREFVLGVALAEWASDSIAPDAVYRFLLMASGAFRMVRAATRESENRVRATLVARLPLTRASALPFALSALSVAARRTRRETRILSSNPEAARLYAASLLHNPGSVASDPKP